MTDREQTTSDIVPVPDPHGPLPAQVAYLRATVWAAMMDIENGMSDLAYRRLASAYERTDHE